MSIGLIGKKQGMTRVFTPEGESFAVSVVSVLPNIITQIKSEEKEGYPLFRSQPGKRKTNISLNRYKVTLRKIL